MITYILSNVALQVFDPQQNILYVEVVQRFKFFLLPGAPTPSRLVVRLNLNLVKKDGLYYIHSQEDFFHPEDVAALLFHIAIPFVKLYLHLGGILSNVGARVANMMGYWRPSEAPSQNQSSTAPSESGLYSKED
ncbi:hypothetical protein CVT26_015762 [Gymnopilus dilepis]|uniref:SigF-like NTF2-like domain-containing protein n=1 Tax=Gymnopilus dilepis TaxID=231916 RepID=A0A409VFN9_9AGAR|nr:hypothetical protein CVT26_015762 [Gymnopilus dilepis]